MRKGILVLISLMILTLAIQTGSAFAHPAKPFLCVKGSDVIKVYTGTSLGLYIQDGYTCRVIR